MTRLRTLIADDHQLFRDGLKHLLIEIFGEAEVSEAGSLDEALELLTRDGAGDLIFADLRMPGMSVEGLSALRDGFPNAKLVVVSGSEEPGDILAAVVAGVHGYIPKSMSTDQIVLAIRQVLDGAIFVPPIVARRQISAPSLEREVAVADRLTHRQQSVLDELLLGKSSKEIARALNIAEGTVKIHLASIYRVIGVRTRAEAIAHYRR